MKKLNFECLMILFCLAASLMAQPSAGSPPFPVTQPPQAVPDPGTITLKVKAALTIEDVTVTDTKGKPVHGLTQADFTIKEDGKPQPIKNFQEYGPEKPQAQAPPPQLPPGTYSNRQAIATNAVNILLLDEVTTGAPPFLALKNPMIAKQQATKYLKTMPEGTQVAILKMANGLSVVQGFTSNPDVLLAAIDSVKLEPAAGTYLLPSRDLKPEEVCAAMNTQSDLTTAALAGIAGFLSGIKGRKNLIWFTPGIPWLTNYGRYAVFAPPCLRDNSSQLQNAYGLLRAARVAVYPIDPKGVTGSLDHESAWDFADKTGGKAYYNRNDLDAAIGEAITNGTDYYSLSYVPPLSKYDGKYHTISVKVDRPGLNLTYREGYTALDAQQPQEEKKTDKKKSGKPAARPESPFHAAMDHGPDASDLTFYVHLQPSAAASEAGGSSVQKMNESLNPKLKGQPLTPYNFEYLIPAGDITFAGGNPSGTHAASAELAIAVFNADGELLNAAGQTTVYSVPQNQAAQFMRQPSRVTVQVDLPPGKLLVRIGVLDVASQKMGILEIP
ncbi:MAG TPA: VWA domain-containing protein, partial [Terracidiphilus sp.]